MYIYLHVISLFSSAISFLSIHTRVHPSIFLLRYRFPCRLHFCFRSLFCYLTFAMFNLLSCVLGETDSIVVTCKYSVGSYIVCTQHIFILMTFKCPVWFISLKGLNQHLRKLFTSIYFISSSQICYRYGNTYSPPHLVRLTDLTE